MTKLLYSYMYNLLDVGHPRKEVTMGNPWRADSWRLSPGNTPSISINKSFTERDWVVYITVSNMGHSFSCLDLLLQTHFWKQLLQDSGDLSSLGEPQENKIIVPTVATGLIISFIHCPFPILSKHLCHLDGLTQTFISESSEPLITMLVSGQGWWTCPFTIKRAT